MKDPHLPYWEAIIRIVRYLKAHPGRGLLYKANSHLRVEAYWVIGLDHRQIENPLLGIVLFWEET